MLLTLKLTISANKILGNENRNIIQTFFSMLNIFSVSEAHAVEFDSFELPTLRKVKQYWNTVGSQEFNKEFTSLIKTLEQNHYYTGIVIDANKVKHPSQLQWWNIMKSKSPGEEM